MKHFMRTLSYQSLRPQSLSEPMAVTSRTPMRYLRKHPLYCVLAIVFLIGMLLGVLLLRGADEPVRVLLRLLVGGYVEQRNQQDFAVMALYSLGTSAVFLAVLFFCGFCNISQPLILLLLLFRGIGYGFSLGGMYAEQGIRALQYVFVLFFIPMLLGTLLLICAARNSLLLSIRLWRRATEPSQEDERYRMRRYCISYFLYFILLIFIALLDAMLATRFATVLTL